MKIAVTFFNSKKDRKIKNVGYYINKRIFKNAIREKVLDNSNNCSHVYRLSGES